jgi:HEAT repeat protein
MSDELVKAFFGPTAGVARWSGPPVDGVDLYWVNFPSQGPDHSPGRGAVVIAGSQVLSGAEGLRAALPRSRGDGAVAGLVSLLVGNGGVPIAQPDQVDARVPAAERALVRAPATTAGVVEYWTLFSPGERPELKRWRCTLATLAVERVSAQTLVAGAQDQVERARAMLASGSSFAERDAIALLAAQCADPRAIQLLGDTVTAHKRTDTRGRAAVALGECRQPAGVRPLIAALADREAEVRWQAADALGNLGDPSARAPLERLKTDPDPSARVAAERALAKLR